MTEYLFPTSNAYGTGITTGPDGNLWVGESVPNFSSGPNASKIGHFILSTPGTPEQRFVTQLYLDLLHRLPEAAGRRLIAQTKRSCERHWKEPAPK